MPRDRRADSRCTGDSDALSARRGVPAWLALCSSAVCLVVGLLAGGIDGVLVERGRPPATVVEPTHAPAPAPAPAIPDARPVPMTREEFRALVGGKTRDEVIQAVGKPDSTSERGSGTEYWYYSKRTLDPTTGRIDSTVQIRMENGWVASVSCH